MGPPPPWFLIILKKPWGGGGEGEGGLAGTPLLRGSPYGPRQRWAENFFFEASFL